FGGVRLHGACLGVTRLPGYCMEKPAVSGFRRPARARDTLSVRESSSAGGRDSGAGRGLGGPRSPTPPAAARVGGGLRVAPVSVAGPPPAGQVSGGGGRCHIPLPHPLCWRALWRPAMLGTVRTSARQSGCPGGEPARRALPL